MYFVEFVFVFVLILCSVYASILGGRTGRAGSAIFVVSTLLSFMAVQAHAGYGSTVYGLFLVDTVCFVMLLLLALYSNRYWPIWALGFQAVTLATHIVTILAPDILPETYQAISSFWSLPILAVMVIGTTLDWQNSKSI